MLTLAASESRLGATARELLQARGEPGRLDLASFHHPPHAHESPHQRGGQYIDRSDLARGG